MNESNKKRVALTGLFAALVAAVTLAADAEHEIGLPRWAIVGLFAVGAIAMTAWLIVAVQEVLAQYPTARPVAICIVALVSAAAIGWFAGGFASEPARSGSPAYARKLSVMLGQLHDRRAQAYRDLSAADRAAQARIPTELAEAFASRASALRKNQVEAGDLVATRRIATRLASISHAYTELSEAATDRAGSQADLDAARARIDRAGRRLRSSERALAQHGYVVTVNASGQDAGKRTVLQNG